MWLEEVSTARACMCFRDNFASSSCSALCCVCSTSHAGIWCVPLCCMGWCHLLLFRPGLQATTAFSPFGSQLLTLSQEFPTYSVFTQCIVSSCYRLLRFQKVGHKKKNLHYLSFLYIFFNDGFFLSILFFKISKTTAQLRSY